MNHAHWADYLIHCANAEDEVYLAIIRKVVCVELAVPRKCIYCKVSGIFLR